MRRIAIVDFAHEFAEDSQERSMGECGAKIFAQIGVNYGSKAVEFFVLDYLKYGFEYKINKDFPLESSGKTRL